jgi:hypothetical protein
MENLAGYLICPKCRNKNQFTIHATVEVHVLGADYLSPYADGELSYGSASLCVCALCKHADALDVFTDGVVTMSKCIDESDVPAQGKAGATIHPIRPGLG